VLRQGARRYLGDGEGKRPRLAAAGLPADRMVRVDRMAGKGR
jgi:hypothetical protein